MPITLASLSLSQSQFWTATICYNNVMKLDNRSSFYPTYVIGITSLHQMN